MSPETPGTHGHGSPTDERLRRERPRPGKEFAERLRAHLADPETGPREREVRRRVYLYAASAICLLGLVALDLVGVGPTAVL